MFKKSKNTEISSLSELQANDMGGIYEGEDDPEEPESGNIQQPSKIELAAAIASDGEEITTYGAK